MKTPRLIRRLLLLTTILLTFSGCQTTQATGVSLDRQLIQSLAAKDYELARSLLEKGADPEAILGEKLSDHAVCTAIDDRTSRFLELLVEFGASTNARYNVEHPHRKTPLVCAVTLYNPQAFEYLLANGANANVDLCDNCTGKYKSKSTILTTAISAIKFPFALTLIKKYTPHENEIYHLTYSLEHFPFNEAHPWNDAREELIQWVYDQGRPNFKPLAAGKPVNGVIHECVFHYRDYEEGLEKGTICRE